MKLISIRIIISLLKRTVEFILKIKKEWRKQSKLLKMLKILFILDNHKSQTDVACNMELSN